MASKSLIRTLLYLTLTGFVIFLLLRFFLELTVSYRYIEALFKSPWTILATLTYAFAFYLRAIAWRRADAKRVPTAVYLSSLYLGLTINHLSPIKLGEMIRLVTARAIGSPWKQTSAIFVLQRSIDLIVLCTFILIGWLFHPIVLLVALLATGLLLVLRRPHLPSLVLFGTLAWAVEALAVFFLLHGASVDVSFPTTLIAMSAGVLSGVIQFTPGGLGTYELAMGTVLRQAGVAHAYDVALMTHLFKYAFAFLVPLYVLVRHPATLRLLVRQLKYTDWKGGRR
ncbi:lysylphosphatidylglycerol synthase domain-containing protein [Exiguobacterium acetylicum]